MHLRGSDQGVGVRNLNGDFVIGKTGVPLKMYLAIHYPESAGDIFQSQSFRAFIQGFKIGLLQPATIVMNAQEKFPFVCILREVDETGIAVLENVVHQLLYDPEHDQFLLHFHTVFVIVEAAARVDGTRSVDFLEKVVDRGFQSEILQGGGIRL